MKFIDYCDKHKILLCLYPPHSTHTLQPLDICLFGPLSQAYSSELAQFLHKSQGLTSITKRDFFRLFNAAWQIAFRSENIQSAFEKTGLWPFNPERIISRFAEHIEPAASPDSSSGAPIQAEDWAAIRRLINKAAKDIGSKETQRLANTVHTLTIENLILKMENRGLKRSLVNEKKRRKKGKALPLPKPEDYHGGAIFYSPSKVQQARNTQARKAEEEKALQRQKEDNKAWREQQKKMKIQIREERARERLDAKEIKALERARVAEQKQETKLVK